MRVGPRFVATSALVATIYACSGGEVTAPRQSPQLATYTVRPSSASPGVSQWDDAHLAWIDTANDVRGGALLVLLPGTGGTPADGTAISRVAAELGYHVIGLMYPDNLAVLDACRDDPSTDCMAAMREEIVAGGDRSPHVQVDTADSITGRLTTLLRHLATQHPGEGWEAYLDGDTPRWAAIAVGGLSQGGGHAAYIAKLHEVRRVVMFGAPADGRNGLPAPWMTIGATPPERYYGFAHERDPFPSIGPNWKALGLDAFGPPVDVERTGAPFGGTHTLRTDLATAAGSYAGAHASVFADLATPRNADGSPLFAAAWQYLLGAPRNP